MRTLLTVVAGVVALLAIAIVAAFWWYTTRDAREPSRLAYAEHCATCHGAELEGGDRGPPLVNVALQNGDSADALMRSIGAGFPERGMPAFGPVLEPKLVKGLALYVSEQRQHFPALSDSWDLRLPEHLFESKDHAFRIEHVSDLASQPYSIAPLPDGRILVTEKLRGVSIVTPDGVQSDPLEGTPPVYEPFLTVDNSHVVMGIALDLALHPDYAENGWVYLSHTHRCQLDCGSVLPVSMVRVVRGRIRDGRWVDQQIIWSVDDDLHTVVPDLVAAGRLTFDHTGHVYVSIGGKATYDWVQDLDKPTGKIHRTRDDGTLPLDNPFEPSSPDEASSARTLWSYGHRAPQGLATHPETGAVWSTEMGPRGGDEVNLITRGGNYGWPLYTNGLDYDGEPVMIGHDLGLDFPIEETEQPVVDFTPAPALSSFTFYEGDRFPAWQHDFLVGSLRGRTLYRLRIRDGELVEEEKLVTDLARIRDVEVGWDGLVYLLLEHGEVGSIVRLVPDPS